MYTLPPHSLYIFNLSDGNVQCRLCGGRHCGAICPSIFYLGLIDCIRAPSSRARCRTSRINNSFVFPLIRFIFTFEEEKKGMNEILM